MAKPVPYAAFKKRLFVAQRRYELRTGDVIDREEFAARIGDAVKWGKPFSKATVAQWFNGHQMPSVAQIEAIALELGVHPAWLAFGSADVITMPDGDERPIDAEPPRSARRQQGRHGSKE